MIYLIKIIIKGKNIAKAINLDFYLPEFNTCIKYDGEQHFTKVFKFDTEEKFKHRQQHDKEKIIIV